MHCRALGAFAAAVAVLSPLPASASSLSQAVPSLVIEGKGFGHGVGMAQDGAYAMAVAGASAADILGHFYPGTTVGRRSGQVRVDVLDAPGPVVIALPGGGEIRDAPAGAQSAGFPVSLAPGGSVTLSFDGSKYRAAPGPGASVSRSSAPAPATPAPPPAPVAAATSTTSTTNVLDPLLQALVPTTTPAPTSAPQPVAPAAPPPAPAASPVGAVSTRGLWAVPRSDTVVLPGQDRRYRGVVQAMGAGRGLHLVNEVDVEQYVQGIGEMPASWPGAALQAQAIAARTFALRAVASGGTLCATQQCQVYIGATNESSTMSRAVADTRGQVLTYQGALAETVYSASAGGISATAEEGFGPGGGMYPYLKPAVYATTDPQPWTVSVPLSDLAARFRYPGGLRQVTVTRAGPSGRPLELTFDGSGGPVTVDAHRFGDELKLRSTLFTVKVELAEPAGETLAALVPGLPSASNGRSGTLRRGILAAPAGSSTLGRAPWAGVALLLLVVWATAAHRLTGRGPVGADPEEPSRAEA